MGEFYLSEIYHGISNTDVLEIILGTSTNVFAPLHIIAQSLADDEGILQVFQIPADSIATYLYSTSRFKRIGDFQDIGTRTYRRCKETYQLFHSLWILQAISIQYIFQINGLINLSKIVLLGCRAFHLHHSRQSTIQIIGFQSLLHLTSHNLVVFRKAQWMNADFPTSSSELCDYVL